jgi:lysophospholipase L1-like esterase
MREESVPINDLNSLVKKNLDLYVGDDLLHLTQEGVEVCAKQVAHVISEYL